MGQVNLCVENIYMPPETIFRTSRSQTNMIAMTLISTFFPNENA